MKQSVIFAALSLITLSMFAVCLGAYADRLVLIPSAQVQKQDNARYLAHRKRVAPYLRKLRQALRPATTLKDPRIGVYLQGKIVNYRDSQAGREVLFQPANATGKSKGKPVWIDLNFVWFANGLTQSEYDNEYDLIWLLSNRHHHYGLKLSDPRYRLVLYKVVDPDNQLHLPMLPPGTAMPGNKLTQAAPLRKGLVELLLEQGYLTRQQYLLTAGVPSSEDQSSTNSGEQRLWRRLPVWDLATPLLYSYARTLKYPASYEKDFADKLTNSLLFLVSLDRIQPDQVNAENYIRAQRGKKLGRGSLVALINALQPPALDYEIRVHNQPVHALLKAQGQRPDSGRYNKYNWANQQLPISYAGLVGATCQLLQQSSSLKQALAVASGKSSKSISATGHSAQLIGHLRDSLRRAERYLKQQGKGGVPLGCKGLMN